VKHNHKIEREKQNVQKVLFIMVPMNLWGEPEQLYSLKNTSDLPEKITKCLRGNIQGIVPQV